MARVLGVIPARGGSKGLAGKNIRHLAGRPLIAYTIESARKARHLTRTLISTESEEIARVARAHGGEVPFLRPTELATDETLSQPVVEHALLWAEDDEGQTYDAVVMLQPTTPLRSPHDIDRGIRMLLEEPDIQSVVSVVDVGGHHPFRMKRLLEDGRLVNYIDQGFEDMRPRQSLPRVHIRSGSVYVARRGLVLDGKVLVGPRCRGFEVPAERAINIDNEVDLWIAEKLLARGGAP